MLTSYAGLCMNMSERKNRTEQEIMLLHVLLMTKNIVVNVSRSFVDIYKGCTRSSETILIVLVLASTIFFRFFNNIS